MRIPRVGATLALLTLFSGVAATASAQTPKLTVHYKSVGGASGQVRLVAGAFGLCESADCTYSVSTGTTVRLAADYPGRFSLGTGPAAACALSTCSFTMTADADVTATFTSGDGPTSTVTTTMSGDGAGVIRADGVPCRSGGCTVTYLRGSMVELAADLGSARFSGYSSATGPATACGVQRRCTFTLSADAAVTGTFVALTSVTVSPSSVVRVAGGPPQTFTATGTYSDAASGVIAAGSGEWSTAPPTPLAVTNPAAAALGGKIYVVGGETHTYHLTTTLGNVSAFDSVAQTWSTRAPMTTSRTTAAAAVAGGRLYAIGGVSMTFDLGALSYSTLASVERYDPAANSWTFAAPMSAPRTSLAAGTVNGIVYAAGGAGDAGVVATLEAYDPATNTWTTKAPMPTPRARAAGGVIDGIFYVAGGNGSTALEAYDPATNTWTARTPMPFPMTSPVAAAADGLLYVMEGVSYQLSAVLAYDPVTDTWSVKAPMLTPRIGFGAAALNGTVYAIAGRPAAPFDFFVDRSVPVVERFADTLHWSSSAPSVARIDASGTATPVSVGMATIAAASGTVTCGGSCATFTVNAIVPTQMSLDTPAPGAVITAGAPFDIAGWAINRGAGAGTGIDAVHIYIQPTGGALAFLGVAPYGIARADIGALYGSQFTNSGYKLQNQSLPAGSYTIIAYAHDALTGTFDAVASAHIAVTAPVSHGLINVDAPSSGAVVTSAFEVGGWAIDTGAPTGSGVDGIQFYVQPAGSPAPGVFVGTGSVGAARPDVGAAFGSQFTNAGFHFTITGLGPGSYTLGVYAHSTVSGSFSIVTTLPFSVNANQLMSIDVPSPEATVSATTFNVGGWSIDRDVASTGPTGTGVDAVHIYAYPNPGSGQAPIFLGVATLGISRPDVGAAYGSRYGSSGYSLTVDRVALGLTPGVYNIAVASHSAVSGTFNNIAVVRVTLQ